MFISQSIDFLRDPTTSSDRAPLETLLLLVAGSALTSSTRIRVASSVDNTFRLYQSLLFAKQRNFFLSLSFQPPAFKLHEYFSNKNPQAQYKPLRAHSGDKHSPNHPSITGQPHLRERLSPISTGNDQVQRPVPLLYEAILHPLTVLPSTMSSHFTPSVVGTTISDLDGWSMTGDFACSSLPHPTNSEEFGFDPLPKGAGFPPKMEQTYTPPDDHDFLDFNFDPVTKIDSSIKSEQYESRALTLDHVAQAIPNHGAAVSRYGQVTPPRSNSEASMEKTVEQKSTRQRRAPKASIKEAAPHLASSGRKKRNARKNSVASTGNPEEDEKRKQSLEKNRLAAAKCRINKKEKTEQLQRDSHEMAVTNAFLKEQVIRMKEEAQQMNALLLSHANCEGCKSPEDIQKHLNHLGNEFFAQRVQSIPREPYGFPNMAFDESSIDQDHYFSPTADSDLMNPPLPEFDRQPEFEVSTPMQTD